MSAFKLVIAAALAVVLVAGCGTQKPASPSAGHVGSAPATSSTVTAAAMTIPYPAADVATTTSTAPAATAAPPVVVIPTAPVTTVTATPPTTASPAAVAQAQRDLAQAKVGVAQSAAVLASAQQTLNQASAYSSAGGPVALLSAQVGVEGAQSLAANAALIVAVAQNKLDYLVGRVAVLGSHALRVQGAQVALQAAQSLESLARYHLVKGNADLAALLAPTSSATVNDVTAAKGAISAALAEIDQTVANAALARQVLASV